jgi:ribosomal protein S14
MSTSNYEARRFYRRKPGHRDRTRCASCGTRASTHSADMPFCHACLDWARQGNLLEWDDLGEAD